MIVVGDNLRGLMEQHNIVDRPNCYDETCIQLSLGNVYYELQTTDQIKQLTYGEAIPEECVKKSTVPDTGLLLPPKSAVLACSAEKVCLPAGYMGLLQTKGSLARLFVSLHFSDGQIDPGFSGHVTFEIFNAGELTICIRRLLPIGNLYLFKTTTKRHDLYHGRYADSDEPTIQLPMK